MLYPEVSLGTGETLSHGNKNYLSSFPQCQMGTFCFLLELSFAHLYSFQ